jgi:uncharacterized phage protein (TIGR01671 family)
MREILFKAKRLDNGEWISGSLVCFAGGARAILPSDSKTLFSKSKGFICCDTCHDVDPSTVCEYTGLKDKNGKRIFEGDNVYDPHENSIYTVEWNENNAIFQMAHDWHRRSIETVYYCEIIGNIYDGEGDND